MIKIPIGTSKDDIKKREEIIYNFYDKWFEANPTKKVFNIHLKEYINVRYISVNETARHAAKQYLSTLAVLQLDSILAIAKQFGAQKPIKEGVKNQQKFSKMIDMRCSLAGIGNIKLIVGVKRQSKEKVQYCITAITV